jgi:hypothetical protein
MPGTKKVRNGIVRAVVDGAVPVQRAEQQQHHDREHEREHRAAAVAPEGALLVADLPEHEGHAATSSVSDR